MKDYSFDLLHQFELFKNQKKQQVIKNVNNIHNLKFDCELFKTKFNNLNKRQIQLFKELLEIILLEYDKESATSHLSSELRPRYSDEIHKKLYGTHDKNWMINLWFDEQKLFLILRDSWVIGISNYWIWRQEDHNWDYHPLWPKINYEAFMSVYDFVINWIDLKQEKLKEDNNIKNIFGLDWLILTVWNCRFELERKESKIYEALSLIIDTKSKLNKNELKFDDLESNFDQSKYKQIKKSDLNYKSFRYILKPYNEKIRNKIKIKMFFGIDKSWLVTHF